jgi:nitronate monooxygenase
MPLRDLLGTDLPLVQAPMAGVQDSGLAIAVASAGALGSIPCALITLETLHDQLTAFRAATSAPVNVNFFCHPPPVEDAAREAAWRAALQPFYDEYGIDARDVPTGAGRLPFTHEAADVVEPFAPRVVSFHFGLPAPELLARVRAWGATVLASATTVDEARWLEARGVDAIVAQGVEAGGHRGTFLGDDVATQVGTLALVPQIVDAVRVPVLGAGGIADARGVAAAVAFGASGVQVGTAYLLCPEATTSAVHRAALHGEAARETALTNLITGRPARGIVNRLMRSLGPMSSLAPDFPLATAAIAPLRAAAEARGLGDFSPLWAGENATGCREIPAADLTRALAAGLR